MKHLFLIWFIVCSLYMQAQVVFKTLGPDKPVVAGESFIVQYELSNIEKTVSFNLPSYINFRVVSGPYNSSCSEKGPGGVTENKVCTVTLEAFQPGSFTVPGASVVVNGKTVRSNELIVTVMAKDNAEIIEAGANDQVLLPGENPYEKIRKNLFLKVLVDRTVCYAGEPILATFKLYSRLDSKSDITKNPGFYGFTVYDVINLADKRVAAETVDGKLFDVHTIRQVQLYPLEPGNFTIDPMEIKNEVTFSKSSIRKKTEQQITEGVNNDERQGNEDMYETNIRSNPVAILVKPVPNENKPASYNGATGEFHVEARLGRDRLARNEEGRLDIIITGRGNFTQLNAPLIIWPAGLEGFEPAARDSLDKGEIPLAGKKIFQYKFIASEPGSYTLPSVSLPYFDPATRSYKTASSASLNLVADSAGKKQVLPADRRPGIVAENEKASRIAFLIILSLIIAGLAYWIFYRKKPRAGTEQPVQPMLPSADEVLQWAKAAGAFEDRVFLNDLHSSMWEYFSTVLHFPMGTTGKDQLYQRLKYKGLAEEQMVSLQRLFSICEAGIFTTVEIEVDQENLLNTAAEIIQATNKALL